MSRRIIAAVTGSFALALGLPALPSCTAVLPPAMYPSASPSAQPAGGGGGDGATFTGDVVPTLQQHCAACHTAGGQGAGEVEMFDAQGQARYDTIKNHIAEMVAAIRDGRMPLGHPGSVPAAQVDKLDAWRAAGAPNNGPAPGTASPASGVQTEPASAPALPDVVSFRTHVVPVLQEHCQACHVTGGIGPFAMFDADGNPQYDTVKSEIGEMVEAIESGKMPKGRPGAVKPEQINILKAWRDAGTPNN